MNAADLDPSGLISLFTVILQKISEIKWEELSFEYVAPLLNMVRPIINYFVSLF